MIYELMLKCAVFVVLFFGIFILLSKNETIRNFCVRNQKTAFILLCILTFISIIVRFVMYAKTRSLWLDEAMLAESLVTRDFWNLLATPLENNQTAPAFYLLAVKLICLIFGYGEGALRSFSFLAFIGLLVAQAILLKKHFCLNNIRTAFSVFCVATIPAYMYYSNELKPYMSDVFFVVLVLLLYYLYSCGKIKLPIITIIYSIILLFSNPASFFIGAMYIVEFVSAFCKKRKRKMLLVVIFGMAILAVFAVYYYLWLMPVANNDYMINYWKNAAEIGRTNIMYIFTPSRFSSNSMICWLFVPFSLLGLFDSCRKKDFVSLVVLVAIILAAFASVIGKYPLSARLWLFLPALVFIYAPFGMIFIAKKSLLIAFLLAFTINQSAFVDFCEQRLYYPGQETNPLIEYVQKNIKEGEFFYVDYHSNFVMRYKNSYGRNVLEDNIIWGNELDEETLGNEVQRIKGNAYLLLNRHVKLENRLDIFQRYGKVSKIMEVYETPLYYFER